MVITKSAPGYWAAARAKFAAVNSCPPDSGAPEFFVRPMIVSCSRRGARSQVSMCMLMRRATR